MLDGLHSNTQIRKVIGFARLHELTRNPAYREASRFFWQTVVERRSFATGGNGDGEHFFPPSEFAAHLNSAKTMETCCAHNMLRVTRVLFRHEPTCAYADYYERALYNSILASQDPESGMMTYFQATRPGYVKLYCTPVDSFWCCTGSGMENHAKYGDSIYFHDDASSYVNLFIASELNWAKRMLRITQETRFPDEGSTRLIIHAPRPVRLNFRIRHPAWCSRVTLSVNGRRQLVSQTAGRYIDGRTHLARRRHRRRAATDGTPAGAVARCPENGRRDAGAARTGRPSRYCGTFTWCRHHRERAEVG